MAKSFPDWQQAIAYPLVFSPLVVGIFLPTVCPPPHSSTIAVCASIGLGFSASLAIVLRRPFNVLGWLGVVGWGLVIWILMAGALADWRGYGWA